MPELPEVETCRRGIAPHLENNTLVDFRVHQAQLRYPIPLDQLTHLIGHKVLAVSRRGKYLLVRFEMGSLLIHLGMSGSLRILTHPHTQPLKKHDHVQLFFERGIEVRYHDPRRFGLLLWAEQHQHPLLNKIGLEPLSEEFSLPWLTQLCQKRTTPIKPLLMTSHLITGVGNIYANESLFCAGIHPTSPAMSLTSDQVNRLHRCIQETLSRAIAQGGSTLRDFVNTEGQPGYFAQTLQVYGRAGQACHRCSTPIEKLIQAQRTSFFCPICQTSSPVNTTQHPSTKGQTS